MFSLSCPTWQSGGAGQQSRLCTTPHSPPPPPLPFHEKNTFVRKDVQLVEHMNRHVGLPGSKCYTKLGKSCRPVGSHLTSPTLYLTNTRSLKDNIGYNDIVIGHCFDADMSPLCRTQYHFCSKKLTNKWRLEKKQSNIISSLLVLHYRTLWVEKARCYQRRNSTREVFDVESTWPRRACCWSLFDN